MDWRLRRSSGVEQAIAAPMSEAPSDADAEFDALYRDARDDVFAYVAGLLRDRSAAEDVTALAFERAYRKRRRFNPSAEAGAPGSSGSRATRPSTSFAGAGGSAELVGDAVDPTRPRPTRRPRWRFGARR